MDMFLIDISRVIIFDQDDSVVEEIRTPKNLRSKPNVVYADVSEEINNL